jgi:hypothetical protein
MKEGIIERAYILLNEPVDPNLKCPVELVDIVNFVEVAPGEDVVYFASPAQDRAATEIVVADAAGSITYVKIPLKSTSTLSFSGLQSNLETILLDEIVNSKDQTALAAKKDGIIRAMDNIEKKNILSLCLAASAQEVNKVSGEDLLDTIIALKQKVDKYCSDYILLVASDVMEAIEKYDKENVSTFNYKMSIMDEIAKLGIKKVVKVVGEDGSGVPVLADGKAILIGRESAIANNGRPLTLARRKFSKEIAEASGATEGASRLVDVVRIPLPVNAAGKQTIGYSVYGYESVVQVLLNPRAISWSDDLIS